MTISQNKTLDEFDKKFMSYALNLSKKHLGKTAPNPVVGCVIVADGEIISSGVTAKNGRPHAEKIAIDKVVDRKILKNSTIYVTLEPCSHVGQTPPCVDEIIKCGFAKVVIATKDSDSRVNGAGIKKLEDAGIEVVCGILEKEAREINRGFFSTREKNRPFVTLKLATSLDGKIATKNFDSKWITSQQARNFAHHLRGINDAILVGANTVRYDDPSLDCRISGLEDFSPIRVIVSKSLDLNSDAKIFQNCDKISTLILTCNSQKKSPSPQAKIILCAEKNGEVDLQNALKKLAENGINSLLIEGGQKIATAFLKENLVDELVWIKNKKIVGNDGIAAIGDFDITAISKALTHFKQAEVRELEEDVITIYRS